MNSTERRLSLDDLTISGVEAYDSTSFQRAEQLLALMISAPEQKQPGAQTDALVEFVDIYKKFCSALLIVSPHETR